MKIGMSSWSYHPLIQSKQLDQMGWVKLCKDIGLDGVELLDIHFPSLGKEYVTGLKKTITDLGLEIPLCSVSNDFGKPDDAARAQSEKQVENWIQVANWFGAKLLRVFSGWPGQRDQARYASERQRLWPEMISRLQRLAAKAGDSGIILALENRDHLGFTRTVDDLLQIIEEVGSDWLGICLNTGDYLVETGNINGYAALEKAMIHTHIVRAKFYELDDEGKDKRQDWGKIFKILQDAVYDGYLSIEYEGKDPKTDVPRAAQFLLEKTLLS